MMRSTQTLVGPIFALTLLASGAAHAADTKIINHSGLPIDELSVSSPGTNQWGPNLLEGVKEGALDSGKSHVVKDLADGTYDFQISAPDEAVFCIMSKVVVKKGVALLDKKMGKACK